MRIQDAWQLAVVIGTATGGIYWAYKNLIKPAITFLNEMKDHREKTDQHDGRISYLSKKLDALIYVSDSPKFVCDGEGLCILANQAVCQLFGATENQMKGLGWCNFIHVSDRGRVISSWRMTIEDGGADFSEKFRILHGETKEEFVAHCHAIISRDGENQVIVSVAKVITNNLK